MEITFTLEQITARLGGELRGDAGTVISGVASLGEASAGQISYFESGRYRDILEGSTAEAVIMRRHAGAPEGMNVILVDRPVIAWATVVEMFHPRVRRFADVSPRAIIGEKCEIADGVGIGPGVYVGDGVRIGKGTEIYPGCTVGHGAVIGTDCTLFSGVHVYHSCTLGNRVILHSGTIIGGDGYGYVQQMQENPAEPVFHRKVPQVGTVIIEDDVEIGANSTVDRAALGATVIGKGTKIDNLVMVAHNCKVGPHCLLVGQAGMAGSVELAPYVTIAAQVGIKGHLKIGTGARIAGQAGVTRNVADGETMAGTPAVGGPLGSRAFVLIRRLPELRQQVRDLLRRVEELEKK